MTSSRTRLKRGAVGLGTVLILGLLSSPAAATPFHFKEFAQGAIVQWTTCPWEEPPPTTTVCHDYAVWYVRFSVAAGDKGLGKVNRGKEQFRALYDDFEYVLFPDGEAVDLSATFGEADVTGYYDQTHLTRAGMSAVTMPLTDFDRETGVETPTGRSVVLGEFRWTAETPVQRYGNDGPVFDDAPHVSDRCQTFNAQAHQQFTLGSVTGTVDGVPVSELSPFPQVPEVDPDAVGGIFDNWFHLVDVTKRC